MIIPKSKQTFQSRSPRTPPLLAIMLPPHILDRLTKVPQQAAAEVVPTKGAITPRRPNGIVYEN